MADLKATSGNDIDLSTNDFELVTGNTAIAQHVKIRLGMFKNDWFLDRRVGIPYYEQILIKGAQDNIIRDIFRSVISDTPGIDEIESLSLDYTGATRTMAISFVASVTDSEEPLVFDERLIL